MYYLCIINIPKSGTMKNEIKFGIMTMAIVAVAAAALTKVLDIIQDADAQATGNAETSNNNNAPPPPYHNPNQRPNR